MIVDEAHNAVTGLTRDMQARVNPCAIVEFTATPRTKSNILYRVTAQELKTAEMIKLPIILGEHDSWQNAVNGAVNTRAALEKDAEHESEYLRPITLFQAQPKDEEVTVELLRKHLIDVEQIAEDTIAVATGDQRELDGIDLFDPQNKIRHVITVQALKEGWDCSFAYVFCSIARIQSATDVEQLLGRVMRMPYAKSRKAPALNRAYAHVSETTFSAAAQALTEKLVDMGFDKDEATEAIQPAQGTLDTGLFGARERTRPVFKHTITVSADAVDIIRNEAVQQGAALRDLGDGRIELESAVRIGAAFEAAIKAALPEPERAGFAAAVQRYRLDTHDLLSPSERGETFVVPWLTAEVQGEFEFADTDTFMEDHEWSLLNYPAMTADAEFSINEITNSFEIDVFGTKVEYKFANEEEQLGLDIDVSGWTPHNLVLWLDRQLRQPDVHQTVLVKWLSDAIHQLVQRRKIHIAALMRAKFILARTLRTKIETARQKERETVYQKYLFSPAANVGVSSENGFEFKEGMFAGQKRYGGRYRFAKHFLGPNDVPAFGEKEDGEEFQCAQILDSLPQVKFWVRNVARHPNAMKLPTATDFFYPDFVAELADGRRFVVEYKGADRIDNPDTFEKNAVGALWERSMKGRGVFATVTKTSRGRDMRQQLLDAIS